MLALQSVVVVVGEKRSRDLRSKSTVGNVELVQPPSTKAAPFMATPVPLLAHSINLTLQFLTLSQREAEPLPPHLISNPLGQRHHFLQLSPDDPSSYLSWPSESDTGIIGTLLQSYIPPVDDTQYSNYPVQYTSDTETTCAHVHVLLPRTPGQKNSVPAVTAEHDNSLFDGQLGSFADPALRLVFLWDHQDGSWKYHDAGLMPFPPHSYSSLVDALSSTSTNTNTMSRLHEDFLDDPSLVPDHDEGEDEDAYWNAYGQRNHDGEEEDENERWPQQAPKPGVPVAPPNSFGNTEAHLSHYRKKNCQKTHTGLNILSSTVRTASYLYMSTPNSLLWRSRFWRLYCSLAHPNPRTQIRTSPISAPRHKLSKYLPNRTSINSSLPKSSHRAPQRPSATATIPASAR